MKGGSPQYGRDTERINGDQIRRRDRRPSDVSAGGKMSCSLYSVGWESFVVLRSHSFVELN